jgi:hypothetical protein
MNPQPLLVEEQGETGSGMTNVYQQFLQSAIERKTKIEEVSSSGNGRSGSNEKGKAAEGRKGSKDPGPPSISIIPKAKAKGTAGSVQSKINRGPVKPEIKMGLTPEEVTHSTTKIKAGLNGPPGGTSSLGSLTTGVAANSMTSKKNSPYKRGNDFQNMTLIFKFRLFTETKKFQRLRKWQGSWGHLNRVSFQQRRG